MAVSSGVRAHRCLITVNGRSFPVTSGSYDKKGVGDAATFSARLPSGLPGAFDFFASLGENSAEILIREGAGYNSVIKGAVKDADFDPIGGTIAINGQCNLARLHATKTNEKFNNRKNHEVVTTLAERVGLTADIQTQETSNAGRYVQIDWAHVTDNVSLASVVHKIAEAEGARWWVSGDTLHFVPRDSDAAVYPVTLQLVENGVGFDIRGDAFKLTIRRNIAAGKGVKVTTKSWNPRKKKAYVGEYSIGGAAGTTSYGYHVSGLNQTQADKHAKHKAKQAAKHELTVTASLVGDLAADPAKKLRLRGCGVFDQDYPIDSIRGTFGMGGHLMTITARSAKKGRT